MSHSDHNTLIARARKAGLNTQELYAALTAQPPEGSDAPLGQSDGNGFVSEIDENGHRVYRQVGEEDR
jgi:hypothetical protein